MHRIWSNRCESERDFCPLFKPVCLTDNLPILARRTFNTRVKKKPTGNSALIEVPFDLEKAFGNKRVKPRIVTVPPDVKAALAAKAKIKNIFDRLSYSHQREYVNWIDSTKKAETRQTRIGKMIKMLAARQ
jgi:Bacteriocin-protection, YdeI or OmpD-Associated